MTSPILRGTAGPLTALLAAVSVFVLLRGHNEPGGGFIGGLLIAAGFALHAVAYTPARTRALLRVDPHTLMTLGLALVAASALLPLLLGQPLLTAQWWLSVPVLGKLSSVLVFDTGVYLTVWGTALGVLLALAEQGEHTSEEGLAPAAGAARGDRMSVAVDGSAAGGPAAGGPAEARRHSSEVPVAVTEEARPCS